MITLSAELQEELRLLFLNSYNFKELKEGFFVYVEAFLKKERVFCLEQGVSSVTMSYLLKHTNGIDMALLCVIPFLNQELFNKFKESLSPDIVKLMDYLVWNEQITESLISTQFGIVISETKRYQKNLLKEFLFFKATNVGYNIYDSRYNLHLPLVLRRMMIKYYPKSVSAIINPMAEIPKTEYVFEGEKLIFTEIERASLYVLQKKVTTTSRGELSATGFKRLGTDLNFVEFYPNTPIKEVQYLRTRLVTAFALLGGDLQIEKNPFQHIKNLFKRYPDFEHLQLLNYLKNRYNVNFTREPYFNYLKLVQSLPKQQWVSIDNLVEHAKYELIPLDSAVRNEIISSTRYEIDKQTYYLNDKDADELIAIPSLQAVLFLWAALGWVDIAYNNPTITAKNPSHYNGLRYVRLNLLGGHLLLNDKNYEPPKFDVLPEPVFSPDSLTITAHFEDKSAAIMFKNYTQKKLGENVFFTNAGIFMQHCVTLVDLKNKIERFKAMSKNMVIPPNWHQFFDTMVAKANPFKDADAHRLIQIPPENTELVSLIARDAELKKYVIKAEAFYIVVFKKHESDVKKRLKELSYLWE